MELRDFTLTVSRHDFKGRKKRGMINRNEDVDERSPFARGISTHKELYFFSRGKISSVPTVRIPILKLKYDTIEK